MEGSVLISGGSGGIGMATAQLFAKRGYRVFEISRHEKSQEGVIHIGADVTDPESLGRAIAFVEVECGSLDILICNAGMGISGAVEFTDLNDAKMQMDVNFFGVFSLIQKALPLLRKSKSPQIVTVSSLAAAIPIPFQAFYSASKAAVSTFTMALANELRPFGIRVSAVLPGDTATGFTDARKKSGAGEALYGKTVQNAVVAMEKDERSGMAPEKLALCIEKITEKKHPRIFYTAGGKNKLFLFLQKLLPSTFANFVVGKLYR